MQNEQLKKFDIISFMLQIVEMIYLSKRSTGTFYSKGFNWGQLKISLILVPKWCNLVSDGL